MQDLNIRCFERICCDQITLVSMLADKEASTYGERCCNVWFPSSGGVGAVWYCKAPISVFNMLSNESNPRGFSKQRSTKFHRSNTQYAMNTRRSAPVNFDHVTIRVRHQI